MKIALIGYGKMGKEIEMAAQQQQIDVVLIINSKNLNQFTKENLSKADVAIEMTGPETAYHNIKSCLHWGVPVVSGSTGWLGKLDDIKQIVIDNNGSFLYAGNFSIGVNLFFEAAKHLSHLMKSHSSYFASIEETHHTQKKDAPSGTATALADVVMQQDGNYKKWLCNESAADNNSLPITAIREGNVPGIHSLIYNSEIDSITLTHNAHNRKGFAQGALAAAKFISNRKGIFTMKEVLEI